MVIHECIQGSIEWLEKRKGLVTSHKFKDATAVGEGKTRRRYMTMLLAERLTGIPNPEIYKNHFMVWGTEHEPQARAAYELETAVDVEQVGFCRLNENIGASPDGLIQGAKAGVWIGAIEIQCPASHTHIENICNHSWPTTKYKQILGVIWVCDLEYCDYVSYDPRMKIREYFQVRAYRDEKLIRALRDDVNRFVDDLTIFENSLRGDTEKLLREAVELRKREAAPIKQKESMPVKFKEAAV